jgi:hypothetical protein
MPVKPVAGFTGAIEMMVSPEPPISLPIHGSGGRPGKSAEDGRDHG